MLLVHAFSGDPDVLAAGLRVARNAVTQLGPGVTVQVVVQGDAVHGLTHDTEFEEDITRTIQDSGAEVLACRNSMRGAGVDTGELLTGVGTVPAAVGHLAEHQWKGAAYVRV